MKHREKKGISGLCVAEIENLFIVPEIKSDKEVENYGVYGLALARCAWGCMIRNWFAEMVDMWQTYTGKQKGLVSINRRESILIAGFA